MADTFKLEIVTPEKKVVDTAAEEVQIPGKNGYLGVLPGHAPLITELAVGEIIYCENSNELVLPWRGDSQRCCRTKSRFSRRLRSVRRKLTWSARANPKNVPSNVDQRRYGVDVERALDALHRAETTAGCRRRKASSSWLLAKANLQTRAADSPSLYNCAVLLIQGDGLP